MHGFYPNDTAYNELYVRFYFKQLSGYVHNNNQKFMSLITGAYSGGIDQGGLVGRTMREPQACPQWTCNELSEGYLDQNQGQNIFIESDSHWYFIEVHFKINTFNTRNGIFQLWINDCGTNGLGCTGTPTLRSSFTNVGWIGGSSTTSTVVGSAWFDIWGNPSDVGTMYIDQLIVSKAGPIGFMGAAASSGNRPVATSRPGGISRPGVLSRPPVTSRPSDGFP